MQAMKGKAPSSPLQDSTSRNFVGVAFLRMSKLQHLRASPFVPATPSRQRSVPDETAQSPLGSGFAQRFEGSSMVNFPDRYCEPGFTQPSEGSFVAKFLCQVQYSPAAYKGMLTKPTDRNTAAAALFTSLSIKVPDFHYSVTRGGIVCIVECTTEQLTSLAMVMNASGGFSSLEMQELVSMEQMAQSAKTAAGIAGEYQAPN